MTRPLAPTINDLAQHLGVHKSTVSRAMDPARRHLISAELLQRVEVAARELGYRPNHAAASLSTGRSKTIGVLLPDITNPVFPPILRGIEDALAAEGYFALLANTDSARRDDAAHAAVERMQAQRVEGFLVATAVRDDAWLEGLRKSGVHIVLVNRTDGRGELPAVISDDMLGMRLAVDHLVGLGHARIAHLAGPAALSTGLSRHIGFEQALRAHGLQPAAVVECAAYTVDAGHAAMSTLLPLKKLRGKRPFTAVVAANDLIALGALQALREHGIAVPGEMSVVGHNDMPLLDQMNPPLSSVRIQHYEMGFRAARLLLEALRATPGSLGATVVLRPMLVLRASTAAPS
ncbi:LacI family DNA-binding transcriptional regulator [Aquabacterium sp.]|uniref:LacI family DNA-binding transcriptional regulator n=1 Tax=Aquabacterium sp. TaxID=1872578 RepID=UPI002BE5777D|nr:LacI family DNA-binding transcriptional regulator [Aquabacterium sp.]HSW05146.1 LacI family DNA-binding transcriptional regulator [Aquabacterium sp.]